MPAAPPTSMRWLTVRLATVPVLTTPPGDFDAWRRAPRVREEAFVSRLSGLEFPIGASSSSECGVRIGDTIASSCPMLQGR